MHDLKDAAAILDVFQKYGHKEIDTARTYGEGSSEEYLGELKLPERGIILDTKLSPNALNSTTGQYRHTPEGLRRGLEDSLKALKTDKVRQLISSERTRRVTGDERRFDNP